MRAMIFTLLSMLACTVTVAATVYRWVDENGVTHYSDQPHENAEKVTVAAPQTYSAAKGYSPVTPPAAAKAPSKKSA